ncbi:MAG: alpha/beta fold hydrolase [Nakamurella sp.]
MSGRFRPMPWWLRVAAVGAGVLILLVGALWAFQRRLIYQPEQAAPGRATDFLVAGQDVVLHTADGLDLTAWYLPAENGCRSTVLIAPGNAGNRAGRAPLATTLADRGLGVLLLEYRGYGGNTGRPDEAGLLTDATAALEFLTAEMPKSASQQPQLIYFGESLGAAVLTSLAVQHPPSALVLRSPFTDLATAAGVAFPFLPVRRMLWDQWPLADELSRVTVPTTVIYGTADTVIPPELSLAVADAAGGPVTVIDVQGANHNDPELLDGPAVIDAVLAAEQPTC